MTFSGGRVHTPKGARDFNTVVKEAYANRIQLWSDGFYRTPKIHYDKTTLTGRPFYYFAYGMACTEVAIDTLTGEARVLAVDVLYDAGKSINPAIDIGQVEGGFVQGMGWLTTEQLVWNDKGVLTTHAPSTYKIPATGDIPAHFKVTLYEEPNFEDNVGGSKAVGEPPSCWPSACMRHCAMPLAARVTSKASMGWCSCGRLPLQSTSCRRCSANHLPPWSGAAPKSAPLPPGSGRAAWPHSRPCRQRAALFRRMALCIDSHHAHADADPVALTMPARLPLPDGITQCLPNALGMGQAHPG